MTDTKDIVFEEHWYNMFCDETELYFTAPVSYLDGEYPEADGCTFLLRYAGKEWNIDDASIDISPYEDDGKVRSDYDWFMYCCEPEFKQALYDIYKNSLS